MDHICIQEESCANHRHGGRHLPTEILTVAQQIHVIFIITGTPEVSMFTLLLQHKWMVHNCMQVMKRLLIEHSTATSC